MPTPTMPAPSALSVFRKETLINGQPATISCMEIGGQTYSIAKGPITVIGLEDDWYEDVTDPERVIATLADSEVKPDLFTFWQRLPQTEPKFNYPMEWESLAAVPIKDFEHWWNKQVKGTTRNMVRKSQKAGVETRDCQFDDSFVQGMTEIFNETSVRQGRRFWHYGKDFETVKRQFSRFLFREDLIGAYCADEMVGFAMIGNAGNYALLGQLLSKLKLRDKAINNALLAHAVNLCAAKGLPYFVYGYWGPSSLSDFKRHCGFEEVRLPRYFVPLTGKGKLALRMGLHHGLKGVLPDKMKDPLKKLRKMWLDRVVAKN